MGSLFNETRNIMKKYNITANKKLGQNFLIDENVVEGIVHTANISKDDLIIEIGPGLGTLTSYLLEKAGKVICIELDDRMIRILKDRFFMYNNFEIINEDVLKVDLNSLIRNEKINSNINNVKVVANLPYYITTPIIMKLLEERLDIESITVMIQKEVADRLVANPGDRLSGAITYTVSYYARAEKVLVVPNNSFIPEPEVTSEVIKLLIRKEPAIKVKNEELLFKIIKQAFSQRRKTLVNALSSSNMFENKEQVIKLLAEIGINEKVRGENLTLEQYGEIVKYIK